MRMILEKEFNKETQRTLKVNSFNILELKDIDPLNKNELHKLLFNKNLQLVNCLFLKNVDDNNKNLLVMDIYLKDQNENKTTFRFIKTFKNVDKFLFTLKEFKNYFDFDFINIEVNNCGL